MRTNIIITTALAALAAAAPTMGGRAPKYYGVSLYVNSAPASKPPVRSPAPIEINKLTSLHRSKASELTFDKSVHAHVDLNAVECRAYEDEAGIVLLTAGFTNKQPAKLGETPVAVGSVLCYIAVKFTDSA